jgi:hypothetical protein
MIYSTSQREPAMSGVLMGAECFPNAQSMREKWTLPWSWFPYARTATE